MPDIPEQRKLAAIMFTDMVGYSALNQRDEKLAQELLEEHRRLLREIFPRFNGTEIKTIGDAFLVEFGSALEAAQCAIEIQRTLAHRNADAPAARQIEIRIGIHIGDVIHRGGDVYGDGVNIASRIEQLANAGGICVSMDVERQIRNALEARFEKLASTELKNIFVPMDLFRVVLPWERSTTRDPTRTRTRATSASAMGGRTFWLSQLTWIGAIALVAAALWWWVPQRESKSTSPPRYSEAITTIPQKSIAVLPFDNLSRDPDNAYFADGIQEEILTRLSKIADLKVISRTSTQRFKSAPANLSNVAQQLGVANVLEGTVQRSVDQVRVTVQLIDARNDSHLWAETFDRKLTDVFVVETEIASKVADSLQAKLSGTEKNSIAKAPTNNTEAYQLYLKGRFFWNKRTAPDLRRSIDYFSQAIEKDPQYALAYAGLADAWAVLPLFGGCAPKECNPKAEAAARRAIQLDETLAEPHASLGLLLAIYYFDCSGSIRELERAIQLNPNYATAHHWIGNLPLTFTGQFDRGIAELKRALDLDPLSMIINANLGQTYCYSRRYEDAIAQLRRTIEMDPGFYYAHYQLGQALELRGDRNTAIAEYQKARELNDDPFVQALLAQAMAKSGRPNEARSVLEQLEQASQHRYVPAYGLGLIHLGFGEREQALRSFEKSYEDRDGTEIGYIKVNPLLDSMRGDPRFEALVQKVLASKTESTQ